MRIRKVNQHQSFKFQTLTEFKFDFQMKRNRKGEVETWRDWPSAEVAVRGHLLKIQKDVSSEKNSRREAEAAACSKFQLFFLPKVGNGIQGQQSTTTAIYEYLYKYVLLRYTELVVETLRDCYFESMWRNSATKQISPLISWICSCKGVYHLFGNSSCWSEYV